MLLVNKMKQEPNYNKKKDNTCKSILFKAGSVLAHIFTAGDTL